MMDGVNLYSIEYYKKTVFKGSYRGMCFRIGRWEVEPESLVSDEFTSDISESEGTVGGGSNEIGFASSESDGSAGGAIEGGSDEPTEVLRVQAWKGPYILEKTDEEIFTMDFDYSDAGLALANEWLEDKSKEIGGR
ncbi:MAG: hypothetical protein IJ807_00130 [Eubacterium sp.]|nr:hypothetical protein [Eubacterium sp.]